MGRSRAGPGAWPSGHRLRLQGLSHARLQSAPGGRAQRGAERAAVDQRQQQREAALGLAALCGWQLRQQELSLLWNLQRASGCSREMSAMQGVQQPGARPTHLAPPACYCRPRRTSAALAPHLGAIHHRLVRPRATKRVARSCGRADGWVLAAVGRRRLARAGGGWAPAHQGRCSMPRVGMSPAHSTHLTQRKVEAGGLLARLHAHHCSALQQPHARSIRQTREQLRAVAGHQVAALVEHIHQGAGGRGGRGAHGSTAAAGWRRSSPCVSRQRKPLDHLWAHAVASASRVAPWGVREGAARHRAGSPSPQAARRHVSSNWRSVTDLLRLVYESLRCSVEKASSSA